MENNNEDRVQPSTRSAASPLGPDAPAPISLPQQSYDQPQAQSEKPPIQYQAAPTNTPLPAQPPTSSPYPDIRDSRSSAPKKKLSHYLYTSFGILLLLVILVPPSRLGQMLAIPVVILGIISGIKFIIESIRTSLRAQLFLKPFIFIGGIGIGLVIFLACAIAALIIGFSKDPNPQSTG